MSLKILRALSLVAATALPVVGITSAAHAQGEAGDKEKALAAYKKGTIQYNLGNWTKAITYFKSAFETYPDAAFLFNIAQSYRQADDCKQSGFFYKRYLAIKPKAPNRSEVETFIKELAERCREKASVETNATDTNATDTNATDTNATDTNATDTNATDTNATDTNTTEASTGDGTQVADAGTDANISNTGDTTSEPSVIDEGSGPSLLMAYGSIGSALVSAGDSDAASQFTMTLGGGYPIELGSITIDAGGLISYTPVGWDSPTASGTAVLTAFLANVGASMEVAGNLRLRGEVGVGLMTYSGLDVPGNVFIDDGLMAEGALSSASVRLAVGAEYELTDAIAVTAQPLVLSMSPAAEGMREDISSINAFQALIGVGYKM